jgi:hypothetical protein
MLVIECPIATLLFMVNHLHNDTDLLGKAQVYAQVT